MKIVRMITIVIALFFIVTPCATAATLDLGVVYSENRQYINHFSNGGPQFYFMLAVADVNRSEGDPVPTVDFSTSAGTSPTGIEPFQMTYLGKSAGLTNGLANSFFGTSMGGPFNDPDGWQKGGDASRIYTFTLYTDDTKANISDTLNVDVDGVVYHQMEIPVATVSPGADPFHPTITWNPVTGADDYRVVILEINCKDGKPVFYNPLHLSGSLTATSYTIPAEVDVFAGRSLVIWVQAREYRDGVITNSGLINRSSYFTRYSAWIDGLPSDDLQSSNGWYQDRDPDNGWIAPTVTANQIDIDPASSVQEQDYFWQWRKDVPGLRGMVATILVDQPPVGDAGISIRKMVAQLANGNYLRAELNLQFYQGAYFVRYRIREYDGETFNELRQPAEGNVGTGWMENEPYSLGIVLIDDMIHFFARGINRFCKYISIPINGDFQAISSSARIATWVFQENGWTTPSTISAQISDVKLIMNSDLPAEVAFDIDDDGQTGLAEAIHALQISSGVK